MQIDPTEALGAAATLLATVAAACRIAWSWLTSLVQRLQDDAAEARQAFIHETRAARADFLAGLTKLEDAHRDTDMRVMETLTSIQEIMRERGIPAPVGAK